MKNKIIIFFTTICFVLFFSCNNTNNCLKKLGVKKTVKENLHGFYNLNLNSCFDVILVDSSAYAIKIESYENIIPLIEREVNHGVLNLKNTYSCTWLKKEDLPKITIYAPRIDTVYVNEPCDIRSEKKLSYDKFIMKISAKIFTCDLFLDCSFLWFQAMATTGTYNLQGKADWALISNAGQGNLNAENLNCRILDFCHLSEGYSKISAYEELNISTIKYGKVDLITAQCPIINFQNEKDKKLFFTNSCF